MPIKFNFNICDNSPECSGKAVCPTKAIYWDENGINVLGEKGVLCVDDSKCVSCGQCAGDNGCPVGAIIFAQTESELVELSKGTEIDISKVKTLFVDRYGAEPLDENVCITPDELDGHIESGVIVIEEFTEWSIQCLLSSIPIEDVLQTIRVLTETATVQFFKCDYTENKNAKDILPSLKIYKAGKLLAQVDGVYKNTQFDELKSALQNSMHYYKMLRSDSKHK